jgi:NAD(P)-dependent dehydrogenase (short-subunit alcohol dehydrogenase family)
MCIADQRSAAGVMPAMTMQGKTCVVTGATSGIGQAAAEALAALGARIVVVARDRARGTKALEKLRTINPGANHTVHYADLSRIADTRRVASEIGAAESRIDVLINNAGALFSYRGITEDGLERTFALNHLSYFLLTLGLRERLLAAVPARVINTASASHKRARLNLDDLQGARGYNGVEAYERSKLCNILFTRELARRLAGTGITANALHPGLVASRFGNRSQGLVAPIFAVIKLLFGVSVERGARTIVYLASSPDVATISGRYFEDCREVLPGREAENDDIAQLLWTETAKLAGLGDW